MLYLYQKCPSVKLLLFSIIFCQKIQISVSVPGNVILQRLHCISVHGYLMSVWLSISSVVVTMAWVVLSISKMLPYSLYLCLIWHGCVVLCCIFMEAWGYVCHSPIILSIPNPNFPILYPILWSHSMDQPFAQQVYPFGISYSGNSQSLLSYTVSHSLESLHGSTICTTGLSFRCQLQWFGLCPGQSISLVGTHMDALTGHAASPSPRYCPMRSGSCSKK